MITENLIKEVRRTIGAAWDSYQLYLKTHGMEGTRCFTPEILEQKYNRTDEDIIREAEEKGIYLIDKDEYLAKIKKEKTN